MLLDVMGAGVRVGWGALDDQGTPIFSNLAFAIAIPKSFIAS